MMRYAQLIRLRPECRDEYVTMHAAVWPEVLATIAACIVGNYSIFLGDDLLFAYFEYSGEDFDDDMARMAACPDTQRWWALTDPMQEALPETTPERRWKTIPEVFHFGGQTHARESQNGVAQNAGGHAVAAENYRSAE
jgi:L-rhamnose mutarotase